MNNGGVVKLDGVIVERRGALPDDVGSVELGYETGMLEFTIVQITFDGDWLVSNEQLKHIYDFAKREVGVKR